MSRITTEKEHELYLQKCHAVDYIGEHLDRVAKNSRTKEELLHYIVSTMRGRIIGDIFGSHETGGFSGVAEIEGHRIAFPLTN